MATKRDKMPSAIVVKTTLGIRPLGAMDEEQIWALPMDTEFDLVPRTKRSNPQLRLYWLMLTRIVKSTQGWPSAEHLSDEIKLTLGYRRQLADLRTGEVTQSVDSIALQNMTHDEFMAFFEAAQELLAQRLHMDPMAFLLRSAAA